jgi:hypothetical protein
VMQGEGVVCREGVVWWGGSGVKGGSGVVGREWCEGREWCDGALLNRSTCTIPAGMISWLGLSALNADTVCGTNESYLGGDIVRGR